MIVNWGPRRMLFRSVKGFCSSNHFLSAKDAIVTKSRGVCFCVLVSFVCPCGWIESNDMADDLFVTCYGSWCFSVWVDYQGSQGIMFGHDQCMHLKRFRSIPRHSHLEGAAKTLITLTQWRWIGVF